MGLGLGASDAEKLLGKRSLLLTNVRSGLQDVEDQNVDVGKEVNEVSSLSIKVAEVGFAHRLIGSGMGLRGRPVSKAICNSIWARSPS